MFLAVASVALQAATCSGAPGNLLSPPAPLPASALETPVLALRAFGQDLLALSPRGLTLYRQGSAELSPIAQLTLPLEGPPARRPGGLLWSEPGARSVWALASGWSHARLLDLDADLAVRAEADALPWPGANDGVRLRPGTDLIEARLPGLGDGPFLQLSDDGRAALDAESRLLLGDATSPLALGPPLARVWRDWLLAGTRAPPGEPDALLLLELSPEPRILARCPLEGSLRAIAVELRGADQARAVLAVEEHPVAGELRPRSRWRLWESRLGRQP